MKKFKFYTSECKIKEIAEPVELSAGWWHATIESIHLRQSKLDYLSLICIKFKIDEENFIFEYIHPGKNLPILRSICLALDIDELIIQDDDKNPIPELVGKSLEIKIDKSYHLEHNDVWQWKMISTRSQNEKQNG